MQGNLRDNRGSFRPLPSGLCAGSAFVGEIEERDSLASQSKLNRCGLERSLLSQGIL